MVKTAKNHQHQEEDFDDGEDIATPGTDGSSQKDGKNVEQKASNSRSKHSETEQRRRSKINERFQILKDLIPPNDQKRDKASLLLEVIEYIQFLQEKLQMHEASYPGWNQEPAKLIPWRGNHVPVESFADGASITKNGSDLENNVIQSTRNVQNLAESDLGVDTAYGGSDHFSDPATPAVPISIQADMYASARSVLHSENIVSAPQLQPWQHGLSIADCTVTGTAPVDQDRAAVGSGTSDISSVYAQRLLKNLTQAFQTSGVDLSQASVSVKLDVGQRANNSLTAGTSIVEEDPGNHTQSDQQTTGHCGEESDAKESDQPAKRIKTGES